MRILLRVEENFRKNVLQLSCSSPDFIKIAFIDYGISNFSLWNDLNKEFILKKFDNKITIKKIGKRKNETNGELLAGNKCYLRFSWFYNVDQITETLEKVKHFIIIIKDN